MLFYMININNIKQCQITSLLTKVCCHVCQLPIYFIIILNIYILSIILLMTLSCYSFLLKWLFFFKAVRLTVNAQKVLIGNRHVLYRMSACVLSVFSFGWGPFLPQTPACATVSLNIPGHTNSSHLSIMRQGSRCPPCHVCCTSKMLKWVKVTYLSIFLFSEVWVLQATSEWCCINDYG